MLYKNWLTELFVDNASNKIKILLSLKSWL